MQHPLRGSGFNCLFQMMRQHQTQKLKTWGQNLIKKGVSFYLSTPKKIQHIVGSNIPHVPELNSGYSIEVFFYTQASLTTVNVRTAENDKVLFGTTVQVDSYDETTRVLNLCTKIDVQLRRQELHVEAFVIN